MRPIIINNVLHTAPILGDACDKLFQYGVDGTQFDDAQVAERVGRSLR